MLFMPSEQVVPSQPRREGVEERNTIVSIVVLFVVGVWLC